MKTPNEILEFNKKCAEFLGYKLLTKPYDGAITTQDGCFNPFFLHDKTEGEGWYVYPKFDSDWNWIMFVIEAIEKSYKTKEQVYGVGIHSQMCRIDTVNEEIAWKAGATKKEAVVEAIGEFLNWYEINKQQKHG